MAGTSMHEENGENTVAPEQTQQPNELVYTEAMRSILTRAQQGDQSVLPALKELFNERPELWREFGDLGWHSEQALLNLASGKSLLAREAISRKLTELKTDLAASSPSPLEELLVQRLALCWLHVHIAELDVAGHLQNNQPIGPQSRDAQQRLDRAHHRFMSSIKQLALVRKLLKPALSPLDLIGIPVSERRPTPAYPRRRTGLPLCEAGIAN
jgi:hypothetical protein